MSQTAPEKAAKKRKRTVAIAALIVLVCVAIAILLPTVIVPNQKYQAAVELYQAGKYEDAIAAFTALDGYRDSAAQIEACETAIKDEAYAAAEGDTGTAGKDGTLRMCRGCRAVQRADAKHQHDKQHRRYSLSYRLHIIDLLVISFYKNDHGGYSFVIHTISYRA